MTGLCHTNSLPRGGARQNGPWEDIFGPIAWEVLKKRRKRETLSCGRLVGRFLAKILAQHDPPQRPHRAYKRVPQITSNVSTRPFHRKSKAAKPLGLPRNSLCGTGGNPPCWSRNYFERVSGTFVYLLHPLRGHIGPTLTTASTTTTTATPPESIASSGGHSDQNQDLPGKTRSHTTTTTGTTRTAGHGFRTPPRPRHKVRLQQHMPPPVPGTKNTREDPH